MATDSGMSGSTLTFAISGASGLIGSALVARLEAQGHTVRRLTRSRDGMQRGDIFWNPSEHVIDARALEGTDAIVHLAGAPIAVRWTPQVKKEIRESRLRSTELIARAVVAMEPKPRVVLSGSAVGFYGDRGDAQLDENSIVGTDFLASVTREWESAASPITGAGVRLVALRTGVVLSRHGGALGKLLPLFRLGLGGPIGSGHQYMSWIALEDHVRAMEYALHTDTLAGPVNFVSPYPVTNEEFAATLGRVLSRPAILPVPALALKLIFGEMAEATLLAGQRVRPARLLEAGFAFRSATLAEALRSILRSRGSG